MAGKNPEDKHDQIAAALRYRSKEDKVPTMIAAGRGYLAERIMDIAEKEKIPLYRDTALAESLVKLGAGAEIPPELYELVAHILVHVARLDKKIGLQL